MLNSYRDVGDEMRPFKLSNRMITLMNFNWKDFLLAQAISTLRGILAVGLDDEHLHKYKHVLREVRDELNLLPLDDDVPLKSKSAGS